MDTEMDMTRHEVVVVCNDLGHLNAFDGSYRLNRDAKYALTCIKDLIKFLRNDNLQTFVVRRQMGVSNIVQNDLIPIIEQHTVNDNDLFDRVMRLLVDLTNPSLLLFKEGIPNDKMKKQQFLQLQSYLYDYKIAFGTNRKVWTVIAKHMTRILELDDENRQVEDGITLERIMILIRNVLHIPIDEHKEKGTNDDVNSHDRIIEAMQMSMINDLLLMMLNSNIKNDFAFELLEIVTLMMREQNAEFLAKSVENNASNGFRSFYEKEKDKHELHELRVKDNKQQLKSQVNHFTRFKGAAFYVKNMKSISDRELVYHKLPSDISLLTFDNNKKTVKRAKNRKPMEDKDEGSSVNHTHHSTIQIRQILNNFCVKFLEESYNSYMHMIHDYLRRNRKLDNDETYYLWAIQFFMEFNRCSPKFIDISCVDETMSVSSFHYLHTLIEHYLEMMKTQKDNLTQWSKRLHYGLKAYRELLFTLSFLNTLKTDKYKRHSVAIKSNIFYEEEYRDLLLHLLHDYSDVKMSKAFLKDLIETNHIFLKMLENYCRVNERVIVRQKVKIQKKRVKKKTKESSNSETPEVIWSEIAVTLSEALQGIVELPSPLDNEEIRAFDPLSEKSSDEQKFDIMKRIRKFLVEKRVTDAVALYRDARNVWSGDDDNAFGSADILPEDELIALNEILLSEFPEEKNDQNDDEKQNNSEDENEFPNEKQYTSKESEFSMENAVRKYAHPNVLKAYLLLLKNYELNSQLTNHAIVRMFHRIAWECKMYAMFYQTSIFRIFQRILNDSTNASADFQEISKFAKFIINKFVECSKKNKKAFVELLFWKGCKEAYEIEEGYDNQESAVKASHLWTEEEEKDLEMLFNQYKDVNVDDEDKDIIDLIMDRMTNDTKTRIQVIRQLKRQGLYTQIKLKKRKRVSKKQKAKENVTDDDDDDDDNDDMNKGGDGHEMGEYDESEMKENMNIREYDSDDEDDDEENDHIENELKGMEKRRKSIDGDDDEKEEKNRDIENEHDKERTVIENEEISKEQKKKIKRRRIVIQEDQSHDEEDDQEDDEEENASHTQEYQHNKGKNTIIQDDDQIENQQNKENHNDDGEEKEKDFENEIYNKEYNINECIENNKKTKKRRRIVIDEDDEIDSNVEEDNEEEKQTKKRQRIMDDDEEDVEIPMKKRRPFIDDDNDENQ